MAYVQNVDGQGQLLIGERLSPVTYHVAVARRDPGYGVTVTIEAARDWLLRQGFASRATLILSSGDRIEMEREGGVAVSDSISVVLEAEALGYDDRDALIATFPELAESGEG